MEQSSAILWRPPAERIAGCELTRFAQYAAEHHGAPLLAEDPEQAWQQLHHWSLREPASFWSALWEFAGVIGERGLQRLSAGADMASARWFQDSRLNYAENLLAGPDEALVLIASDESGRRSTFSRGELRSQVHAMAAAFAEAGIGPGSVVAGFLSNTPEAVIAMLAAAHLGACWTSTSPDFGAAAAIERLAQTGARLLVATGSYRYGGRLFDCTGKIAQIMRGMPDLRGMVLVGDGDLPEAAGLEIHRWQPLLEANSGRAAPPPCRVAFDAPLFVLYSSGTTGKPKAIVHGVGGTLLQHRKEHLLHVDMRPGERVFFYTTCGWMMWNWLVSALACQAVVVLYDGSPTHPDEEALWRLAAQEQIAVFGTSPRFLAAMEKAGLQPRRHGLSALRTLLSTGAPLAAGQFDYVYEAIAPDLQLASISGGTDIVSCFCLGSPWLPVRRGEIQAAGLGMATEVVDAAGQPVREQRGELVCAAPFPSMPLGFLGDADGLRYRQAYFARFPGIWHHGDYAIRTASGGFIILGRSDAVLNPGGVRIGTAEIYRQVERLPEVLESLAIGQKQGDDERIVLFVRMREGLLLDAPMQARIRAAIRDNSSPRHVPAKIIAVPDLPRTLSGKLVELAVRDMVHGLPVANREALANPESLELFRDHPGLRD